MKVYVNNKFKGYWPVGTAAVVIADSAEAAKTWLDPLLEAKGLPPCKAEQFEEIDIHMGQAVILCDGNY